jgi:23S rRNA maturation mini-RNase III
VILWSARAALGRWYASNQRDRSRSGEVETYQAEAALTALEGFLVGNQDLERLDALLDHINIFEDTGWYW